MASDGSVIGPPSSTGTGTGNPAVHLAGPLGLGLLLLAGVGLWWLGPWSPLPLVAAAWVTRRERTQPTAFEDRALRWVLLAAAVCTAVAWGWPVVSRPSPGDLASDVQSSYKAVWDDLAEHAASVADGLPELPQASRAELFAYLADHSATSSTSPDVLLLDGAGEAVAWAGRGLLHEPEGVPPEGLGYRSGLTAVTLFAARRLGGERPHTLIAGRSLGHGEWPFGGVPLHDGSDWWLGAAGGFDQGAANLAGAGEILEVTCDGAPSLYLAVDSLRLKSSRTARNAHALAWLLWALTWIVVRRPYDLMARRGGTVTLWWTFVRSAAVVLAALGLGQGLELGMTVSWSLALGAIMATWGVERYRLAAGPTRDPKTAMLLGLLAGATTLVGSAAYRHGMDVPDLASHLLGDSTVMGLRLTLGLLSLGWICFAAQRPTSAVQGGWSGGAILLLLVAAASHDNLVLSGAALLLGTAAAVRWAAGAKERGRVSVLGPLLLMAALVSSSGWEMMHRQHIRHRLANDYLAKIAPPHRDEINDLLQRLQDHFAAQGVAVTRPAGPGGDLQDLAFVLWRQSPLAANDGLSALVVEPFLGATSSFSFGLALDAELEVVPDPDGWRVPPVPAWRRSMLWGEASLGGDDAPWGTVRYAFLPRPGFRLSVSEVDELEAYLVQGESRRKYIDGLPRGALFGLYDATGGALASPWREAPPLPAEGLDSDVGQGQMDTLSGRSWFWKSEGDEGIRVLFLPLLGPLEGMERVGVHALGSLLSLALLGFTVLLLMWPVRTFQQVVERTLSSYARRLILVYTVLLLVPLIALNLVLVGSFEQRLIEQQRVKAQEAISSARVFLIDYLQGLDPGFGISTQIDRTLMEWMTQVVQHQVNLYWGSRVYASSQQELFTAGLLPRRIPGEIFARLAYRGYEIGERRQSNKDQTSYLELYAPLDVPGLGLTDQGLFLSVPLLEQDKDVDRELATFRRRALLVSSGLFLLLVAVGSRLAHSFTKPIMTLIQGTRQIARGATSLPWRPREEELSSLAAAIDDMAGSLAEGRRRLLREKELVERIVDNTTSGVVSVDRGDRVLLHNRVAAELLGTTVGEKLLQSLHQAPHLAPLAERLQADDGKEWQATLRIRAARNDEARDWNLMWLPLPGDDPAALLLVDDVTEVLKGQRLSAWAEMARIIAHEIKNPLTPIRLSTEHMQQVYRQDREQFDQVFERCTDNILRQVEELRDIASDFSIYSRIPKAELVNEDLIVTIEELLAGYGDAARTLGTDIKADLEPAPLHLRFDRKLLGRAIRNLIENALRATGGEGEVELKVRHDDDHVTISVGDRGPGVDPGNLERIFEPYFSTHESGTGLGLAITRRIVEEHGGHIEARNRPEGGLVVSIGLPARTAPDDTAVDV